MITTELLRKWIAWITGTATAHTATMPPATRRAIRRAERRNLADLRAVLPRCRIVSPTPRASLAPRPHPHRGVAAPGSALSTSEVVS